MFLVSSMIDRRARTGLRSDRNSGPLVRLVPPGNSIRIRTRAMGPAEVEPLIVEILRARRALPSQWLPVLTARRIADG